MGQPAEARALVGHLLNVRRPYDYTNPLWALVCQGVEELTENFEADTEDVQYICETTKTTNVKGYNVGFDLEMKYVKDSKIQKWANHIVRIPPTGSATSCDYIRFNKDEIMYGTNNQFIGVRRHATVQASSIGGSATDSLTTSLSINASSDPEVGYITIDNSDVNNVVYSWTPATTEAPIITSPVENSTQSGSTITITGTGIVGATVTVYYGLNQSLPSVTVNANGIWSTTISASQLDTIVTIAAIQTVNGMSSVTSDTVTFSVIGSLSAPTITVPANNTTGISRTPTISGTGRSGATITVSDGTNTILTTTVSSSNTWTGVVSNQLTAETEYTITATQNIGTVISPASTSVTFTTVAE